MLQFLSSFYIWPLRCDTSQHLGNYCVTNCPAAHSGSSQMNSDVPNLL